MVTRKKTQTKRNKYKLKRRSKLVNKLNLVEYYNLNTSEKKKYKSTHNPKGVYNNKNLDFKDIIFYSSHNTLINSSQTGGYPVRHEKYINNIVLRERIDLNLLNEFLKNSINKCSCLEIDISKCVECGDDPNEDICKKLSNEAPIYDCEVKHLISDSISLLKVFKNIEKKYKQKTHELSKFPPLLIDLDTTQIKSSQKLDSYNKIFDIAKKVFKEGINKKYKKDIPLEFLPFPKNIYLRCHSLDSNKKNFPLVKKKNTQSLHYNNFLEQAEKSKLNKLITRSYPPWWEKGINMMFNSKTLTSSKLLELVIYGCNIPAIDIYRKDDVYVIYEALFKDVAFLKVCNRKYICKNFDVNFLCDQDFKIFYYTQVTTGKPNSIRLEETLVSKQQNILITNKKIFPLLYFEKKDGSLGGALRLDLNETYRSIKVKLYNYDQKKYSGTLKLSNFLLKERSN